jgi:uncharacterized protein (DUF342 family)
MELVNPEAQAGNAFRREPSKDAEITVTFLNHNLEARGDFFPHEGFGAPVTADLLQNTLENFNVIYGIQHDEIGEAYTKCLDGEIVKNVLLARGDPPVDEIPEYLQMNPYLEKRKKEQEQGEAVDHRARSPFIIVKKDQVLAKLREKIPGKEGTSVQGEPISFQLTTPDGVNGGENTRMEGDLLLANISGQLLETKKVLSVNESLLIKGSVGYNTGNIIFPGNVDIHGTVSDGFKIYAAGSVNIRQTFDVSDSVVKKDLTVAGGIIGRSQAMLKVGGNLKTKFIVNCRVACRNTISVDTEIINSFVYTMGKIEMTEKGYIVGGEIYALKGIRAGGIGKRTGKATRIHCGVDFALQQEKEKNNSILKMLPAKIARLQELIDSEQGEKREQMEEMLKMLYGKQIKAKEKISELLVKMENYWDTSLEVTGEIVPGTLMEICQKALFVTEPLKKVKISYSRGLGKLLTEKL